MVIFDSPAARRSALVRVTALCILLVGGGVGLRLYAPFLFDPTWVRKTVAGLGPAAPLAFVAIQATQVVVAPIPGQALGTVGGYLFGTVRGTLYSMVGVTLGSSVVFVLANRFGRPYAERVVDADVLARFDAFADDYGVVGLFVVFLLPTFPDDAVCLLAGLSPLRLRTLLALVVLGRTPTFAAAALVGDRAASGQFGVAALALAGAALLTVVVYVAKERGEWGEATATADEPTR